MPELIVGKKYHIIGYHTVNFTGELVAFALNVATFEVTERVRGLKLGERIDVHLSGAKITEA